MIDAEQFIRTNTEFRAVSNCPEISLHTAASMDAVWETTASVPGAPASPPFWAVTWSGGQALARYLLDTPEAVAGRSVFDFGSGSGLCAIAAAKAGALLVIANDTDPLAGAAIAMNARANSADISVDPVNHIGRGLTPADIVLAGDMWYERHTAERATDWLAQCARAGSTIYLGDKRRAFFPRSGTRLLAEHQIATGIDHEAQDQTTAYVWQFTPPP